MEAGIVRRHAKATRAHSAVGLYAENVLLEPEDGGLLSLVAILGELMTRLRDRACNGDGGSELDLRSALLAVVLASFAGACCRFELVDGVLVAPLRLFRVAFMISVANMDRSLGDSCSLH